MSLSTRLRVAFLALLLAPAAALAQAPGGPHPDPQELMGRLVYSPPAYKGIRSVVVWSPEGARAMEFGETREGDRVRLEVRPTVELGPAVLLGQPARWQVYQPSAGRIDQAAVSTGLSQRRLQQAFRSYAWRVAGLAEVAGRPAWVVEASATYPGGFRNVFWIDRDQPVVLQREKFDAQDRLVYRSTFVTIDYAPDIEDRVFDEPPGGGPAGAEAGPGNGATDFAPRVPRSLMPGFVQEHSDRLPAALAGARGHHTVYSDGLECVSLFQFSGSQPVQLEEASSETLAGRPARVREGAEGNMITWSDGRRSFLVVSWLPCATLEPVVQELAPQEEAPSPGLLGYLKRGWNRLLRLVGLGG